VTGRKVRESESFGGFCRCERLQLRLLSASPSCLAQPQREDGCSLYEECRIGVGVGSEKMTKMWGRSRWDGCAVKAVRIHDSVQSCENPTRNPNLVA
jgi:hypothetical protein